MDKWGLIDSMQSDLSVRDSLNRPYQFIIAILVFRKNPYGYGGIYVTTDYGTSWNDFNNGLTTNSIYSIAVSDNAVFTGTGGSGIFFTMDDAANWVDVSEGLLHTDIRSLAVGTSDIFAGTFGGSIYKRPLSELIPVELTSFTADALQGTVKLSWTTSTETNNKGFEVQRSQAGDQNTKWRMIGFVEGNGTTTKPGAYTFFDKNVITGSYSYRLRQIDFDGSYEYSNEIEITVDLTPKEYALYQNYPNPFNPSTKIQYAVPGKQLVTIKVYDLLGKYLATIVNEEKQPGAYSVDFNGSSLATGIYLYKIQAGNYVQIKKMILVK